MNNCLTSVVVTTYKRDMKILRRALDSVYAQTAIDDIEVIIVNDFPAYKTHIERIIRNYPGAKLLSHEKSLGACKSRNDGAKIASGKYIAFLDDDDEWLPNKIEVQIKCMKDNECDMSYCKGMFAFDDGSTKEIAGIHSFGSEKYILPNLIEGNYMGGCSFPMLKKETFDSLGGFDESFPSSQDYELWIRFACSYKISYVDRCLVLYHLSSDSITNDFDKRLKGYDLLVKKHRGTFLKHKKQFAMFYKNMIKTSVLNKSIGKTLWYMFRSIECSPYAHVAIAEPFCLLRCKVKI